MPFTLKGNLKAYLCDDCIVALNNVKVLAYRVKDSGKETLLATAAAKETFRQLSNEEVQQKRELFLAEAFPDDNGDFELVIDNKAYTGGALDIDFTCGSVPIKWPRPPKKENWLNFNITTLQPAWKENRDQQQAFSYAWEYRISSRNFCRILGIYKAYVICGHIVDCKTKKPLPNIRVEAFDVDLIQDDALGSGVTNSSGHFMIFYDEADFSKTIFSWLNVEWPAGPDIYFKFYDAISNGFIYAEDRDFGRSSGRENRGHCFCVDICLNYDQSVDSGIEVPAYFRTVGGYDIYTQFNANGRTNDAEDNAFTGSLALNGNLPPGFASNAIEYRFRIQRMVGGMVVNEYIPGFTAPAAWIKPTLIGSLTRNVIPVNPWDPTQIIEPYYLNNGGAPLNVSIGAEGWIKVPRENNWATGMYMHQYPGQVVSLAVLDTLPLVNEAFNLNTPGVHVAGTTLDVADRFAGPDHVFRIICETRKVSAVLPNPNPISQNILQKINIWNGNFTLTRHPGWNGGVGTYRGVCMIEIQETIAVGCGKVNNTIHVLYSAYHPYIAAVSGYVEGPGGNFGGFSPTIDANGEASGSQLIDLTAQPNCAYILWATASYRLTSGYGRILDNYNTDHIGFCKG